MARAKRRGASGGGTIRQRADGRWEARITIGRDPITGKQKQRSFYGATQREVRQKLQQAAVEVDAGTYVEPSRMTLDQWLNIWLTEYKTGLRYGSLCAYQSTIKCQISPYLGPVPLSRLNHDVLQRYFNGLSERVGPSSIRRVHNILSGSFSKAVSVGHLRLNPLTNVETCARPETNVNPLSRAELLRLLDAIHGTPLYYPVAIFLFSGLRRGELVGLTWDRIDYERGLIVVDRQLKHEAGEWVFRPTKNGKTRFVPMPNALATLFRERRREQLADRLAAGSLWREAIPGLVFTRNNGKMYNPHTIYQQLRKVVSAIGRPDVTLKSLRHTFAVDSLLSGANPKAVQGALGHHSAAFTLDVYAHYTDELREDAANKMDAFISSLDIPQRVK